MINYNNLSLLYGDTKTKKSGYQRIPAIVKAVDSDNAYATVKLAGDDNLIKFINKSGEVLSVDDSVYVEYYNGNLTSGYIAMRNGKPKNNYIESTGVTKMVVLTQAEYDGLTNVNSTTMYVIVG